VSLNSISHSAETLVLEKAVEVIGDRQTALRWMESPVRALGFATPASMLGTETGANTVLAVLSQLDHGIF
jgi:putative toxin-antitoxin system antitoxin component (TIGR02293 family)